MAVHKLVQKAQPGPNSETASTHPVGSAFAVERLSGAGPLHPRQQGAFPDATVTARASRLIPCEKDTVGHGQRVCGLRTMGTPLPASDGTAGRGPHLRRPLQPHFTATPLPGPRWAKTLF